MKKFLNGILNYIRLWFSIKKVKNNINNAPSIIPESVTSIAETKKEQEAPWFQQENILINMDLAPPIVYSGNFNNITIRKQDQYGYMGADTTVTEEDEFDKLAEKGITYSKEALDKINKDKTAKFLSKEQEFNARWTEIKATAELEKMILEIEEDKDQNIIIEE